jgi:hypothetical protein
MHSQNLEYQHKDLLLETLTRGYIEQISMMNIRKDIKRFVQISGYPTNEAVKEWNE